MARKEPGGSPEEAEWSMVLVYFSRYVAQKSSAKNALVHGFIDAGLPPARKHSRSEQSHHSKCYES
jgi:hypothetical protein